MNMEEVEELCENISSLMYDIEESDLSEIVSYLEDNDFNVQEVLMGILIARGKSSGQIDVTDTTIPYLKTAETAINQLVEEFGESDE